MSVDQLRFISAASRCDYYRKKIAQHTPPKTEHDKRMIRVYQGFIEAYEPVHIPNPEVDSAL